VSQEDKGWFDEVRDKYVTAVVHITKIDKALFRGKYRYFYPPRIGIDFYLPEDYPHGPHDFVPNLELGDVARLIKILELVGQEQTFTLLRSGKIKPFKIGLAFEKELQRRIIVGADDNDLVIRYKGRHWGKDVGIEYCFTREGAQKFVKTLKELIIEYIGFIQRYTLVGKIDPRFE